MSLKPVHARLILWVALFAFVSSPMAEALAARILVDKIAAVVNGEAITCQEVEMDAKELAQRLHQSASSKSMAPKSLIQRALENRIVTTLQLQRAKELGLTVDEEELNRSIAEIEAQNGIPAGQLKAILQAQGIDYDLYLKRMREQLLISKLINTDVRSKLLISEESMREYYRKYMKEPKPYREIRLRQIFLSLPPEPTPEQVRQVHRKILQLRKKAMKEGHFDQLAMLYSEDAQAAQGGDMGWFSPGSLPPRFSFVLQLPVGAISEPIRSPNGFHLIQVVDERWHEPLNAGESYDELHVRHILLKVPADADEATKNKIRKRAEQIAKELAGASDEAFAIRAKEVSQGPSASRGGDLGWFRPGTMVPSFEQAALKLQPGETSGVVETPFGFHIIRLIERRHIDPNSYEANRDRIQQILLGSELQEQLPRWIAGLKARASIERKGC